MFVLLIVLTIVANSAAGQELDADSLAVFTIHFRKALLEEVAYQLNVTVNTTNVLKAMLDDCKPKMQKQTSLCKECTQAACQKSPTFEDYLKLANPYLYLKEPLDNIGGQLGDAVELIGEEASGFYNSLNSLGNSITSFPDEAKEIFSNLNKELGKLDDYFKDLGDIIIDAGTLVKDLFDDIFGKKRRRRTISDSEIRLRDLIDPESVLRALIARTMELRANIDPDVRACMEQCSSCTPLLQPTQQEIIESVCGSQVITLNNTIQTMIKKIKTAYNYALDKNNPIVQKVVLNIASLEYVHYTLSDVEITAYLANAYTSYQTDIDYPLLNLPLGGRKMGLEYWTKITV
ncbi:uncharacterized protein LOC128559921 [Mercenaria mercenaria]|uniref:uncharacterized protein LOC128559921 n=1 Tax=Mercenaria mercenaria TaxID=6596 RepID=UPI00234F6E93|nr:uncharacterized protein LOC128559921 [Mercenaria mercenaria]